LRGLKEERARGLDISGGRGEKQGKCKKGE
jgi:hypothetical protein